MKDLEYNLFYNSRTAPHNADQPKVRVIEQEIPRYSRREARLTKVSKTPETLPRDMENSAVVDFGPHPPRRTAIILMRGSL